MVLTINSRRGGGSGGVTTGALQTGYGLFAATGLVVDGTTDNTAAVLAALATISTAGGGTLRLPPTPGTNKIRCDGQIAIPNDGASPPRQVSVVIAGAGADHSGQAGGQPSGGTVLDLRYDGGVGKIDTRGLGVLTMRDLSLYDGSAATTTPFIQTTNTTLRLTGVAFWGNPGKSATACDQDAIVLGGTNTGTSDGTANSPFQGYDTVIERCSFDRIRRGVYLRTYANGVVIANNIWGHNCGSNLAGGAAIESLGDVTNADSGLDITGNVVEMGGYPYAIKCQYTLNAYIAGNNYYDQSATTLAYIRLESNAIYNTIIAGFHSDTKPHVSEAVGAAGNNTIITGHQAQATLFAQRVRSLGGMDVFNQSGEGPHGVTSTGDRGYLQTFVGNNPYPVVNVVSVAAVQVTDGVTTSGSPTVTSATAAFVAADLGLPLGGTGIPANSRIAAVNSATSVDLSANATITNTGVTLNIGRASGAKLSMTGFSRHHIISTGTAPTAATDTGAGTSPSVSVAGTDLSGQVTLTTGTTPPAGSAGSPQELCHIAPNINFTGSGPRIALTPRNAGAAQMVTLGLYVVATTSSIQLWSIGATPASTAMIFDWHAIQ
jgi:hypothetical protein